MISFELLSLNLYEFIKLNNFKGLSIGLIRRFAVQILNSLLFLKEQRIIHCDLKPENVLLKQANRSGLKVIDFGSACFDTEKLYTYIQSRFYRAPEIMLGLNYTVAIDMWSFGCILAELYTGIPLFPGESEGDQMNLIMEVQGVPPLDMLVCGSRTKVFFGPDYSPLPFTNSKGIARTPGSRPLATKLACSDQNFVDFLESNCKLECLNWNPEDRCTPEEALKLPWILQ